MEQEQQKFATNFNHSGKTFGEIFNITRERAAELANSLIEDFEVLKITKSNSSNADKTTTVLETVIEKCQTFEEVIYASYIVLEQMAPVLRTNRVTSIDNLLNEILGVE